MELYFAPQIIEDIYELDEIESKHCIQVLRHKNGDEITIIDGKGGMYTAIIAQAHPKHCRFKVIKQQHEYGKMCYNLHLAIAPTKNIARMEWFLEKAAEIGISEITPLFTERSERMKLRTDRLEKILISAIKQTNKAYLPVLHSPKSFKEHLLDTQLNQKYKNKYLPHVNTESVHLKKMYPGGNAWILVGPEGDFSPKEITFALNNGFAPVSLGSNILRTETAGVYICSLFNILNA